MTPMSRQVLKALENVGIESGDTIFVHADATTAIASGNIFRTRETLKELTDCFVGTIGPKGNFIVPTFNYDFCKGKPYSHEKTPSQVGLLSNYVLRDKRAIRSFHPIYSVAAIGPRAEEMTSGLSKSSFGEGSIFHRLHQHNVKLVCFNVSFYFCTFIHYVEQKIGIDYRFMKNFTGTVSVGGKEYIDTFDFYARYLDRTIVLDMTRLEKELVADARMKKNSESSGHPVLQVKSRDVFEEAVKRVKLEPYYLLKNPPVIPKA